MTNFLLPRPHPSLSFSSLLLYGKFKRKNREGEGEGGGGGERGGRLATYLFEMVSHLGPNSAQEQRKAEEDYREANKVAD